MKTISLKIDDKVFVETEEILSLTQKPRNVYINEAIKNYNSIQRKALLEDRLKLESALVHQESLNVLKEFESI